jgi:diguanylate cyclase (GGDEF)-like protein
MLCVSERNPLLHVMPMSLNDGLTRLYNREGFICAAECLLRGVRENERWACLLTLEVKHLDVIDEALGSEEADRFLMLTGVCLREVFRRSAVIGRVSATRFAVLFVLSGAAACDAALKRLIETIDRHNAWRREIDLSVRGGFSRFETHCPISVGQLLIEAEQRLETLMANACRSIR